MFLNLFYLIKCIHYSNHLIRLKTLPMAALHFPKPKQEFMNFRKCGYNDGECILFNLLLICSKARQGKKGVIHGKFVSGNPSSKSGKTIPWRAFFPIYETIAGLQEKNCF